MRALFKALEVSVVSWIILVVMVSGAPGIVLCIGEDGHLGWVDSNPRRLVKGTITSEPLLSRPAYSAPALSRGRLFLRNEEVIACYDLRS